MIGGMNMGFKKMRVEMGKQTSVAAAWADFHHANFTNMVPSAVQLFETKKAFYAGFYSSLGILLNLVGGDDCSEEDGVVKLEGLKRECEDFFTDTLRKAGLA